MARLNYYLRTKTIFFDFTHRGLRLQKTTGLSVNPKYWDSKKGRAKISVTYSIASEINKELSLLEQRIFGTFNHLNDELGRPPLKSEFLFELNKKGKSTIGLVEFSLNYLEDNPENFAPKTIAGYRTTVEKIKDFHDSLNLTDKSLDLVDYAYYSAFISYCRKSGDSESNIQSRRIKNFKSLMKKANMLRETNNDIYRDSRIKRKRIEPIHEVVRKEELDDLMKLELNKIDEKYRDFIVFGVYTGARISDLKRLSKKNVIKDRRRKGAYNLVFRAQKGKQDIIVPINEIAYEILIKYNYEIYPGVSEPTLNKAIKRVCSKLPTMQLEKAFVNSNGDEVILPRYKKITAHTLRRSFCTRLAELGMPLNQIRKYSGHKTIQALERYIKTLVDLSDENVRDKYF